MIIYKNTKLPEYKQPIIGHDGNLDAFHTSSVTAWGNLLDINYLDTSIRKTEIAEIISLA